MKVIVAGGFIGLEVAENLLSAGVKTTLLEFADHVTPPLDADIVVMGVGVTPDTQLAKDAGLKLGLRGPIVIDKHLRTSAPHVWAVGDAIQLTNAVSGLPVLGALAGPANKQGSISAHLLRRLTATEICWAAFLDGEVPCYS